jgi:tetratricopeptide (TPR) repeat protein
MIPGFDAAGEKGDRCFAEWLLRPYVDLGPLTAGPLYARGIGEYWRAFIDPQVPPFALQRTLPPAFRAQLIAETGRREYGISDPRELPPSLRNDRWSAICEALDSWLELPFGRKRALILLLHSLCLYEPVLKLVPEFDRSMLADDTEAIELAYWRASARYVLGVPSRIAGYRSADLSVFESIARQAPNAVPAAFNAAVKIFAHKAKTGAGAEELASWHPVLERALERAVRESDQFTGELLTSRYYRVLGFLPQKRKDRKEVVRVMRLAERHARKLKPATKTQELLYLENLHPVMESRTKEALWLGKRDLALERARSVVKLDPYDSKAWVELGQVRMLRKEWAHAAEAYVVAAMLGPPASAIGRHMAGVCFRRCGQDMLAAFFFKDALEVDPHGVSPHLEIGALPDTAALKALKEWSLSTFD